MEKITQMDIDWLLNLGKKGSTKKPKQPLKYDKEKRSGFRRLLFKILIVSSGVAALVILPFILLIRTSVYLYAAYHLPGWIALSGGMLVSVLLLTGYMLLLFRKVSNKKLLIKYSLGSVGTAVAGFCIMSLFYLSGVHAKSSDVRDLYRSMHPVLRVAVSTVTLADSGLVITDIVREEADYRQMDLPVNTRSLHYRQPDGYVRAVDIRTIGRGEVRNTLLRVTLHAMGFRTLRHVGSADHLHVELPVRG